jgi:hypothetical protein
MFAPASVVELGDNASAGTLLRARPYSARRPPHERPTWLELQPLAARFAFRRSAYFQTRTARLPRSEACSRALDIVCWSTCTRRAHASLGPLANPDLGRKL